MEHFGHFGVVVKLDLTEEKRKQLQEEEAIASTCLIWLRLFYASVQKACTKFGIWLSFSDVIMCDSFFSVIRSLASILCKVKICPFTILLPVISIKIKLIFHKK